MVAKLLCVYIFILFLFLKHMKVLFIQNLNKVKVKNSIKNLKERGRNGVNSPRESTRFF